MNLSDYMTTLAAWLFMEGWWLHATELNFIAQAVRKMERRCGMLDQIIAEVCDVERAMEEEAANRKRTALAAMNDALTGRRFRPLAILGVRNWPEESEISALFRKAVIEFGYHPDHGGTADMFRKAQEALDCLKAYSSNMAA